MTTSFAHRNLPRLLLQARESVMAHTRPSLREHGLSDQQWRVLRVLGEHGAVETGRVAREAYILGPSLTGVLARMERDGLVAARARPGGPAPHGGRGHGQGAEAGGKALAHASRRITTWMEKSLGKEKLAQLYELLDEVIELEQP